MVKRIIAGVVLLCAIPLLANAGPSWFLGTQAMNSGGTISSPNMNGQKVGDGQIFRSYTTQGPLDVTITANTGYTIRSVSINNVPQALVDSHQFDAAILGWDSQTGQATVQVVNAVFLPSMLYISASNDHGTVTPGRLSSITYGYTLTSPLTFYFVPSYGYQITNIKNIPLNPLVTHSPFSPGVNKAVTVTFAAGYVLTDTINLQAEAWNPTPYLAPMLPQSVLAGTAVNLNAALANNVDNRSFSYSWSYASGPGNVTSYSNVNGKFYSTVTPGPALTLANAGSAQASFTAPSQPGQYKFAVTASASGIPDITSLAVVNVVASSYSAANNLCQFCHRANGIGEPNLFSNWSASQHRSYSITCERCHVGAGSGGHPGTTDGNVCRTCHVGSDGNVLDHPVPINGAICTSCHNPHSTVGTMPVVEVPVSHFSNSTSAGYPASYMSSRANCNDCHDGTSNNAVVRSEWAGSGHAIGTKAPWSKNDFKTMAGCVQCHTTTGFISYSTGRITAAWGSASDKTKEILSCVGCHSDITAGVVRNVATVQPFAADTYRNRDLGTSNICVSCHSGTNNGASIQSLVGSTDFGNTGFIAPHYLAAGATLQGQGGYHFSGQVYPSYSTNSHSVVGVQNRNGSGNSGPCVACHMSASQKHLYQAASVDSNGNISAITATVCSGCHGGSFAAADLQQSQDGYQNALSVLKAMLADKGFVYSVDSPYFSNTNWGNGQAGADVMGAAFNYELLLAEPGGYAHNSSYVKKLVSDSIDVLYNGKVTGSVDGALSYLVGKGAISQTAADGLSSYVKNSCTSCHGGTSSSALPMASNGHATHLTGSYGPGAFLGGTVGSCQTCHVFGSATHANGTVDLVPNGCAGCHPAGTPTWSDGTRLACTSCHAATPSTLPNGVAAPYKASFDGSGHGQFAASNQCLNCHDPNSAHISGTLGNSQRLLLAGNALCASCHNDAAKVGAAYLNMNTHRGMTCATCHDPHGTANLSMIREAINGSPITFTDRTNGLIDTVSWRGLCQTCHTTTNHYRAGVPETNHFTSGCLSCHHHNEPTDGFFPDGNGNCDSCHGYPPVPKNTTVVFGTDSNWVDARYEDYSGGGGAHLTAAHISPFAKASEGFSNCTICHNGGRTDYSTPYHKMVTPVQSHIDSVHIEVDPAYRFGEGFTIYTGAKQVVAPATNATGSCFNIACHMSPSRRWGTER